MLRTIRTIIFMTLMAFLSGNASAQQDAGVSLFNGTDLTGWKGDAGHWTVKDSAITGHTEEGNLLKYNTFLVWEGGQPANFELRLQYRIVGGNSGVQYRSRVIDEEKFVVSGYQADIDSNPKYSGMMYEEKGRGIVAQRGHMVRINSDGKVDLIGSFGDAGALQAKIKNEDWNDYRIVARGNRLKHFINGQQMSEVVDLQTEKAAKAGVIALQVHQGPPMTVQFKDITLQEIK